MATPATPPITDLFNSATTLKDVFITYPGSFTLLDIIQGGYTLKDLTDIRFSFSELFNFNINIRDYVSKIDPLKPAIAGHIYDTINKYSFTGASISQIKLVEFILTQVLTDQTDSYSIAELMSYGYSFQSVIDTRYSSRQLATLGITILDTIITQIEDFKSSVEETITRQFYNLLSNASLPDDINALGSKLDYVLQLFPETCSITEFIITGYSFQSVLESSTTDPALAASVITGIVDLTGIVPINIDQAEKIDALTQITSQLQTSTSALPLLELRISGYTLNQVLTASQDNTYSITELIIAGYFFQEITDTIFYTINLSRLNIKVAPEILLLVANFLIKLEMEQLTSFMSDMNNYKLASTNSHDNFMLTTLGFTDAELEILGIYTAADLSNYSVIELLDLRFSAAELIPFGINITLDNVKKITVSKNKVKEIILKMIDQIGTSGARSSEIYFVEYILNQILHDTPDTYSITELMVYGFSFGSAINVNFVPQQLKDITIEDPRDIDKIKLFKSMVSDAIILQIKDIILINVIPESIRKMGDILDKLFVVYPNMCSISEFIITGLSFQTLIDGNTTSENLAAIGVDATLDMIVFLEELKVQIRDPVKTKIQEMVTSGLTLKDLIIAGYTLNEVLIALPRQYSIVDLIIAGYFFQEKSDTIFSTSNLIPLGVNSRPDSIKTSVKVIHKIELEILNQFIMETAPFTKKIINSISNILTLIQLGYSAAEVRVLGFTASDLITLFTLEQLLTGGFTASDLITLFTLDQLLTRGVTVAQLLAAGTTITDLLAANVTVSNIVNGLLLNNVSIYNIYTIIATNSIPKDNILITLLINHTSLASILTYGEYSASELLLKFTKTDLLALGYSTADLVVAGIPVTDPSCFNTGTSILCISDNGEEINVKVEDLKVGMSVKSYLHGSRKILILCKGSFKNDIFVIRNCMFKMKETGLMITGGHAILVDELTASEEKDTMEKWDIKHIDDKVLLMAGYSDKFDKQMDDLEYTYYHFCLENDGDELMRYGVYAEGVLVETPAEKCIKQFKEVVYL